MEMKSDENSDRFSFVCARRVNFFFFFCGSSILSTFEPNFCGALVGTIFAVRCSSYLESRFKREIHNGGNGRCAMRDLRKKEAVVLLPHK